jgi:hypothetical protein
LKFFPHLQHHFRTDAPTEADNDALTEPSEPTFLATDFLSAFQPSSRFLTPPSQPQSAHYERKLRTYHRELKIDKTWSQGGFDGFISVSSYDPQSYLTRCLERLEMSANVAIYSPYREVPPFYAKS